MIEIFAGTPWQVGLLQSILKDNGIESYAVDGIMGTLNPWWTSPGGAGSVRLEVKAEDAEQARIFVEAFENSLNRGDSEEDSGSEAYFSKKRFAGG